MLSLGLFVDPLINQIMTNTELLMRMGVEVLNELLVVTKQVEFWHCIAKLKRD